MPMEVPVRAGTNEKAMAIISNDIGKTTKGIAIPINPRTIELSHLNLKSFVPIAIPVTKEIIGIIK